MIVKMFDSSKTPGSTRSRTIFSAQPQIIFMLTSYWGIKNVKSSTKISIRTVGLWTSWAVRRVQGGGRVEGLGRSWPRPRALRSNGSGQFRIHARSAPGRRMGCPPVITQSSHQQDGQNAYYMSVRIVEYCLWTFPLLTVLQHFLDYSEKFWWIRERRHSAQEGIKLMEDAEGARFVSSTQPHMHWGHHLTFNNNLSSYLSQCLEEAQFEYSCMLMLFNLCSTNTFCFRNVVNFQA